MIGRKTFSIDSCIRAYTPYTRKNHTGTGKAGRLTYLLVGKPLPASGNDNGTLALTEPWRRGS